jgi:hypothetical protein
MALFAAVWSLTAEEASGREHHRCYSRPSASCFLQHQVCVGFRGQERGLNEKLARREQTKLFESSDYYIFSDAQICKEVSARLN